MNHGMDPDWCAFLCVETESCTIVSGEWDDPECQRDRRKERIWR